MSDERAFLTAILERPDDDARKLVYADWLEERNDPRGEYLRGMMELRRRRSVSAEQQQRHRDLAAELAELRGQVQQAWLTDQGNTPESRERQRRLGQVEAQMGELSRELHIAVPPRLQELAAQFDPNWLAVVSDPEIEGCAHGGGDGWRLHFDFVCTRTWADLKPTDQEAVRHCDGCSQSVHYCDNLADAREHAQENHCIAMDLGVIRRDRDLDPPVMFMGSPSPSAYRESYRQDLDPVSAARLAARKSQRKQRPRR